MKKSAKTKTVKTTGKKSAEVPILPGLVEAMAKLVERLESVEKKTDLVLSRLSELASEMRQTAGARVQRPQEVPPSAERPLPGSAPEFRKERILYQAVCADCQKNCQVPFKPGSRPVYCKECFVLRKSGHVPQDLSGPSVILNPERLEKLRPAPMDYTPPPRPAGTARGKTALKEKPKAGKKARKK